MSFIDISSAQKRLNEIEQDKWDKWDKRDCMVDLFHHRSGLIIEQYLFFNELNWIVFY
jgi:hypothetical protein